MMAKKKSKDTPEDPQERIDRLVNNEAEAKKDLLGSEASIKAEILKVANSNMPDSEKRREFDKLSKEFAETCAGPLKNFGITASSVADLTPFAEPSPPPPVAGLDGMSVFAESKVEWLVIRKSELRIALKLPDDRALRAWLKSVFGDDGHSVINIQTVLIPLHKLPEGLRALLREAATS